MMNNLRPMVAMAGLAAMAIASSANAAVDVATTLTPPSVAPASSYTYQFKTFYDTSTINPFDTKTLAYSVASLTVKDIAGGVQLTLTQNGNAFPAKNEAAGTYVDNLWLNGTWGSVNLFGNVASTTATVSGTQATGSVNPFALATTIKDGGYAYNGNITFAGAGITEGNTSVFTIKGTGVSAYNFAKSSNVPMLELSAVGGVYNTLLSGGKVNFIAGVPTIPEPSTYALMGLGLAGITFVSRRAARRGQ